MAAVLAVLFLIFFVRCVFRAKPNQALVRRGMGESRVSFSALIAAPVIHRVEVMDLSPQDIVICRAGKKGVVCKDNLRADVTVRFTVRVNRTASDVLRVAQSIGCARAGDPSYLSELFTAKFTEALKTISKRADFSVHWDSRETLGDTLKVFIDTDLHGFILEGVTVVSFEVTPVSQLDPSDILDAEGIKKLREIQYGDAPVPPCYQRAFNESQES